VSDSRRSGALGVTRATSFLAVGIWSFYSQ
jgi:hypothetical protein